MSLEQIALVADVLAAVAVLVSLVYLARQLRDSSKSARAGAVATLLAQYDSPNALVASDKPTARILRLGLEGGDQLDADETLQFQVLMAQYMAATHSAFRFYRDGILPAEVWGVFRRDFADFMEYPGLHKLLPYFKQYFLPDPLFVRELEAVEQEQHQRQKGESFRDAMQEG